ncbi:hypothetical protein AUJ65_03055 [Candidatus Micrarchaeota archaeon CG1_02_51_15]|nr:MAG: hypothetical protein AUJ65_03055 [Candidatus Micrarchaeota archaeon CG1_02_51_15]
MSLNKLLKVALISAVLLVLAVPLAQADAIAYTPSTPASGIETNQTNLFVEVQITGTPSSLANAAFNLFRASDDLSTSGVDLTPTAFNLRHYTRTTYNQDLALGADQSGLAYSPTTNTVYSVRNSISSINELYRNGTLKREITTTGFQDVEAITFINNSDGYDWFAITEEQLQNVSIVRINAATASISRAQSSNYDLRLGTSPNNGLEGIAYDSKRNVFYAFKEKLPMAAYQVNISSGIAVVTTLFNAEAVFAGIAADLSDAYYDANTDNLFILSHQSNKLMQTYLNGTIINSIPVGLTQAEGVTFGTNGETMWIISEPDRWSIYQAQNFTCSYNFTSLADGTYNYNVTARYTTNGSATSATRGITITTSTRLTLQNAVLKTESNANRTNDDLLLNWNSRDPSGRALKNITNWYLNSIPLTVVNLPFEAESNSESTKEYVSNTLATVTGAVWNPIGGRDSFGAYEFDGNSGIGLNNGTGYLENYTFSAWVKRSVDGQLNIFANGNNNGQYIGFHHTLTNQVIVSYRNPDGTQKTCYGNTPITNDGRFHHIAITVQSTGRIEIYVDGTQDTSRNCRQPKDNSGFNTAYSTIQTLGAHSKPAYNFKGTLDDIQVYNQALTPQQINAIYHNQPIISNTQTQTGQTWQACITPNTGVSDGTNVCSNTLLVR